MTSAWHNYNRSVLPAEAQLKAEFFGAFLQNVGPCFLAGRDFNSKSTLWGSRLTTTKGSKLAKAIQAQNYSYLSTGSPTYWPKDANKIPDLLDFFITNGVSTTYLYADVQASYDLTSDHITIIVTISMTIVVRKPALRLHTSQNRGTRQSAHSDET